MVYINIPVDGKSIIWKKEGFWFRIKEVGHHSAAAAVASNIQGITEQIRH